MREKNQIHVKVTGSTYCIGHVKDHDAVEVIFIGIKGTNNYLQLRKKGVDYTPIPIPENKWVPTNTYTTNDNLDDGSIISYEAQIMEKVDNQYIAHSNVFGLYFAESVGTNPIDKEEVPPVFKSLLEKGIQNLNNAKADADRAQVSANNALTSEKNAKLSETNAKKSEEKATAMSELADKVAIKETATGNPCVIDDSADWHLINCKIKGSTTQGAVKSIRNTGKNLMTAQECYLGASQYQLIEKDGRSCVSFTSSAQNWVDFKGEKNTQYTVSVFLKNEKITGGGIGNYVFGFKYDDGTLSSYKYNKFNVWEKLDFTSDPLKTVVAFGIPSLDYETRTYVDINTFQLEKGSAPTPYEPYKGQTITFSKPIELAQDESIEKVDGVYSKVTPTGITPLPLVDQQALESLQTFYPNTTFTTDTGITLEPTYVADTKTWVLKQISKANQKADQQLVQTMSLLPEETQAQMIDNDLNKSLEEIK